MNDYPRLVFRRVIIRAFSELEHDGPNAATFVESLITHQTSGNATIFPKLRII